MYIEKMILSNFRCFSEDEEAIFFERDITCLVGNNGSGKTALLVALKRLFGTTRDDRTVIRDDFHIRPDEEYREIYGRQMTLDVYFSFPELKQDASKARDVCPAFSSVIFADEDDNNLKARMRLEARWDTTEYEDEVQSAIYWVTTSAQIEFGDDSEFKFSVSNADRKNIRLRYIPAFRDSKATLKNEVSSLTKILEDYSDITSEIQEEIEALSDALSKEIQALESIDTVVGLLEKVWNKAHDETLKHYQEPQLEATSSNVGDLLKSMTLKLAPSEDGSSRDISDLSDGQISLLYFSLSIALYEIEQKHFAGKLKGFRELDRDIPVFTIFAYEEPENHLSPFYLGRVIALLQSKTRSRRATGLITSHSPSVVRRMNRVEQIRHFRQEVDQNKRYSVVSKVSLPNQKTSEDYKYISQAVLAHPELYFSKLVVLGEGASEEIVIPRLAECLGFDLDPSFVSFVPLGGRHVNHMWRLLSDLSIPFLTLLDLDLGRLNAGQDRILYVIKELEQIGENFSFPDTVSEDLLNDEWLSEEQFDTILEELENNGVYFSFPLDFDMALIRAFPDAYDASAAKADKRENLEAAVLG
ncbi:MAG: AAA family ATPase, partial [Pseudomonadales bacterium]|nr:AAA family ATPase [Pseudomonadales bacterium]